MTITIAIPMKPLHHRAIELSFWFTMDAIFFEVGQSLCGRASGRIGAQVSYLDDLAPPYSSSYPLILPMVW